MRITAAAKDATRKRILKVAQKQFAQHGFETTTTRDIARAADIAVGTLFNYFPTKESIVGSLVSEAFLRAGEDFAETADSPPDETSASAPPGDLPTLDEALFAFIAANLRELKPYRKYLPAVLETAMSPLAAEPTGDTPSLRVDHLETVMRILAQHGQPDAVSPIALQLYWTLYTGVLAFWSNDSSPKQEDTLALVDQSLAMFVGWLTESNQPAETTEPTTRQRKKER